MEYKEDEAYMAERVRQVGVSEPWPWLGMPSGVGLRNPGMSVWVYLVPGQLLGGDADPTVLARVPQALSLIALGVLVALTLRWVPAGEREAWWWAIALAAVNPVVVWLQRKIWAQSTLALFSVLFLVGWWRRRDRWGAFLWGVVGACLGQVHMSGFFYAGGFLVWTILFDRKGVRWGSWLAGSLLGALPLLPWMAYLLHVSPEELPHDRSWVNLAVPAFWVFWAADVLGVGVCDPLLNQFWDYLGYPLVDGRPTCLFGFAFGAALLAGLLIYLRAAWRWASRGREPTSPLTPLPTGKRGRGEGGLTPPASQTALAVGAALWGFGLLLTASGCVVHRHYLLIAFPLAFVWLARTALGVRQGRGLLLTLCLTQALLTAGFLYYIHANQGATEGNYGRAYGAQD